MKAAFVEKPGVLKVREIPEPKPGDYEVLCELLFGAVCSGTDRHLVNGTFPFKVNYPTVLGHESVGRVLETGRKVKFFKKGDIITRVGVPAGKEYDINWGGFAEYGIAKDHWSMYRDGLEKKLWFPYRVNQLVPVGINPAEATMIITWRETLSYLKRMGIKAGSRILVIGSGGNALAFAAHAANLAASCAVLIGNGQREAEARAAGATDYFDYQSADVVNEIAEKYTEGFDFIIDAVGKQGNLDNVMRLLSKEGTLGVYGLDNFNTYTLNPWKTGGTFKFYNGGYNEEETHDEILVYMKKGLLDASKWMDLSNPLLLEDIGNAFVGASRSGKVKMLVKLKG